MTAAPTTSGDGSPTTDAESPERLVPAEIFPPGDLPPLRYRELPAPIALRSMVGPSVMLAGLALGSGEYVFWPYITFRSGFTFFWACLLGVVTQYFVNMEITRWALATGESAVTGFARLSRHWAGLFLFLNVVPWMIPAWAVGAAQQIGWIVWGGTLDAGGNIVTPHVAELTIATLVFCGIALTAGPVVYDTVEKTQFILVSFIMIVVVVLGVQLVRPDAVAALVGGLTSPGVPDPATTGLSAATLLGAIAFAGAGGTMNLGQSNYVKEKGYGMGRYIGRMTSPLTGKEETVSEIGYHFPHTPENLARWQVWWRRANVEHFLAFFCTCVVCLVLLALISYSVFYTAEGTPRPEAAAYHKDMAFLYGEAGAVETALGPTFRLLFLVMGAAILFTTEIGVLDAASRISMDIVKVNWLRDSRRWTESRLYFLFLWSTIALACVFAAVGTGLIQEKLTFFKLTASLNGAVMFLYSGLLLYLNRFKLPKAIRMGPVRTAVLAWAVLFFGFFAFWTGWQQLFG